MSEKYVIGIDYGTDSVRSVVVNAANGEIAGTSVFEYPGWKKGLWCDSSRNMFRQHPRDYIEGLEQSMRDALKDLPQDKDFNGLPDERFLERLDPVLKGVRERLYRETYTCDVAAGAHPMQTRPLKVLLPGCRSVLMRQGYSGLLLKPLLSVPG